MSDTKFTRSILAASAAATALLAASGALAGTAAVSGPSAQTQQQIDQLENQVQSLQQQVQDLKRSTSSQYSDQAQALASQPKITFPNGRPTFTSADGAFSIGLRSIVQFDSAYYAQSNRGPSATDLNSGTNFRRARIGFDGKAFGDWEYSFIYDFGGSGVEGSTISQAYLQYDGLGPVVIRAGAFPPYASLEDSGGAADLLFLERASINEISRGLAGGDGRSAFAAIAAGDSYLLSLAYTGGKVGTSGTFDEQQGLLGRAAWLPYATKDVKLNIGVNGSYIFDPADSTAGHGAVSTGITYQNPTELRVDATNLITTGNIDARSATHVGVDAGFEADSFYAEGGYTRYEATRRNSALADPHFDGWYAEASFLLTGEQRRYDAKTASFRNPVVAHPLDNHHTGWGAWEIAARYTDTDLNFNAGTPGFAAPPGGIRGGEQKIWTAGLNWYPNSVVRALLNYQNVDIKRLNTAGGQIGQKIDQVSLRLQVAF